MNLTNEQLASVQSALTFCILQKKGHSKANVHEWTKLRDDIQNFLLGDNIPVTVRCPPSYQENISESAAE